MLRDAVVAGASAHSVVVGKEHGGDRPLTLAADVEVARSHGDDGAPDLWSLRG